ncbi:MAG: hypothetical protein C3F15_10920 [Holophagae bacterium]|nr:MAG: hypothetical protein C3F15_10920 [Holophagae bacterium]
MTLPSGTRLGPYEILTPIGAGAMGEVYRARDTRLGREVAVKVIPAGLSGSSDRISRFEQEARAAGSISHPNVCAIFDIGTHDGSPYVVMELLEGESLQSRLGAGQVPVRTAIEWAAQAAHGLAAAHEKGIVHRDLKPANLYLTRDGRVKLLDFGLAKLTRPEVLARSGDMPASIPATETGTILGTAGYMAPEQVRGEGADHRADIFALGTILYELLAGKRAFPGATFYETSYRIVNEDPEPLSTLGRSLPSGVEGIVRRCLEKRPQDRFTSAHDLALALDAVAESLRTGQPIVEAATKSIVVLPFENLSPNPENEFFADGLTEELIADLSKVRALRVISRTSAMLFKGSKKDLPTIARELGVRYALEGSVRRAGSSLRISAQLIDANTDDHLWAEKYGGTLDDVFAIQEKVSRSIVDALKVQLTPQETQRLAQHPIPNALAYEFYLKARQEILKWTRAGLDRALTYLHSGLEITGPNAVLFAGLAYVQLQHLNLGSTNYDDRRREAESWIGKALALDPECPQVHFVLGVLRFPDRPREAIRHLQRVLETNPDDFDALYFISCLLGSLGQTQTVVPLEERAARLDPLNPAAHFHLGFNRLWEGKFRQAREVLQRINREFPDDPTIKFAYGLSLAYLGERDHAGAVFGELAREQPGTIFSNIGLSMKHGFEGNRAEAMSFLEAASGGPSRHDFQYACWLAECYALIDEREAALEWLERDVQLGMVNYPYLNEYDPFFAKLRDEPRFQQLMARVKGEWERFEV